MNWTMGFGDFIGGDAVVVSDSTELSLNTVFTAQYQVGILELLHFLLEGLFNRARPYRPLIDHVILIAVVSIPCHILVSYLIRRDCASRRSRDTGVQEDIDDVVDRFLTRLILKVLAEPSQQLEVDKEVVTSADVKTCSKLKKYGKLEEERARIEELNAKCTQVQENLLEVEKQCSNLESRYKSNSSMLEKMSDKMVQLCRNYSASTSPQKDDSFMTCVSPQRSERSPLRVHSLSGLRSPASFSTPQRMERTNKRPHEETVQTPGGDSESLAKKLKCLETERHELLRKLHHERLKTEEKSSDFERKIRLALELQHRQFDRHVAAIVEQLRNDAKAQLFGVTQELHTTVKNYKGVQQKLKDMRKDVKTMMADVSIERQLTTEALRDITTHLNQVEDGSETIKSAVGTLKTIQHHMTFGHHVRMRRVRSFLSKYELKVNEEPHAFSTTI